MAVWLTVICILILNGVCVSEEVPQEDDIEVKDKEIVIDEKVKDQLLNDEKLYQIQKEQEKDQDNLEKGIDAKDDILELDEEIKLSKIQTPQITLGFVHAFIAALSVIIVSEIGDKTFFIAAILAMKYSRWLVFCGALSALGLMTFLSVCLGYATIIIPRWVTFYICTLLLALFGLKMLYEGWNMSPDEGQEEFEEVSAELKKKEQSGTIQDTEQGNLSVRPPLHRRFKFLACFAPIFLQAFSLTFLAEWGDRSQLTTIILSARENPVGVTLGGTLGHALCTALAVLGGKMISERISVRTVTLIGGVVFLLFAVTAFLHDPSIDQEVTL